MQKDSSFVEDNQFRIMTRTELSEWITEGKLISKETYSPTCLEPTSYDVRVGKTAVIGGSKSEIDLTQEPLTIEAGCYAGVISHEKFLLPTNVSASIGSKRKFSYEGIFLLTGSLIDPGYEGHLLFGLYNASTKKVVLNNKTKLCNITFYKLGEHAEAGPPNSSLLAGELPEDFINTLSNTHVLPWTSIREQVEQIQAINFGLLDLKNRYGDIMKSIEELTQNVNKVDQDLGNLALKVSKIDSSTE